MSTRLRPEWIVVSSVQNVEGDRCVDVFRRPNRTFGFEEFRRDPEDGGAWTPLHHYSATEYADQPAADAAARRCVVWLARMTN